MQLTWLLRLTLVFTLMVILMGAYTRLSDAGLGCPDWPGCYGHIKVPTQDHEISHAQYLFPDHDIHPEKAWLEMIHRYIAGTLGVLVVLVFILCLKTPSAPKKLPIAIVLLLLFQAALGMWTVTMKLMPIVVMSHLIGGFSLLSLLLVLYLRTHPRLRGKTAKIQSNWLSSVGINQTSYSATAVNFAISHNTYDPPIKPSAVNTGQSKQLARLALLCLLALVIQIMLGGWTSSNYAALACSVFPLCEGNWMVNLAIADAFSPFQGQHPSFEFGVLDYHARMTIHIAHRIGAMITASLLLLLAYRLFFQTAFKRLSLTLVALVILQICLGISNVAMHLPLGIAVSHNGGAALLLLTLVAINYFLWRKAQ